MLRIYGVALETTIAYSNVTYFDFVSFYLRKADAEAEVKDLIDEYGKSAVKIVPLEVMEKYER